MHIQIVLTMEVLLAVTKSLHCEVSGSLSWAVCSGSQIFSGVLIVAFWFS